MATKLDKTIKREIEIDGTAYTVAISPEGVKLTQKGFRKGQEMSWTSLLAGSAAEGGGGGATRAASAPGTPLAGATTAGATAASRSGWRPADVATDAEDDADARDPGGSSIGSDNP